MDMSATHVYSAVTCFSSAYRRIRRLFEHSAGHDDRSNVSEDAPEGFLIRFERRAVCLVSRAACHSRAEFAAKFRKRPGIYRRRSDIPGNPRGWWLCDLGNYLGYDIHLHHLKRSRKRQDVSSRRPSRTIPAWPSPRKHRYPFYRSISNISFSRVPVSRPSIPSRPA